MPRHARWKIVSVAATALVVGAAGLAALPASAADDTVITVDPKRHSVQYANTHGFNMTAMYGASGAVRPPSESTPRTHVQPKLVNRVRAAGISTVRFPAGTGGNMYRWKDGRGPQNSRGCWNHFPGNTSESGMEYGIAEHMRFVRSAGARTTVVLNFTSGTAYDAADMVEYLNAKVGTNPRGGTAWAKVRAADGHPEPYGVKRFELGNEMNHPGQSYWTGLPKEESKSSFARTKEQRARAYAFGVGGKSIAAPYFPPERVNSCVPSRVDTRGTDTRNDDRFVPESRLHSRYFLRNGRPDVDTVRLWVDSDRDGKYSDHERWQRRSSLADSGPKDHHFRVDHSGEVFFPDGVAGETAERSLRVRAAYRAASHGGFVDYAKAIKDVDDNAKVCASFADEAFLKQMGSTHRFDCLVAHAYLGVNRLSDVGDQHDRTMDYSRRLSVKLARWTSKMRAAGNRTSSGSTPATVVTEFGLTSRKPTDETYRASMDAAVYTASMYQSGLDHGYPVMLRHALLPVKGGCGNANAGEASTSGFMCDDAYTPTALGALYDLLDIASGPRNLRTTISGNSVKKNRDWTYRVLSATTVKRYDDTVRILVTNRGLTERYATIRPGVRHAATVNVKILRGSDEGKANCRDYNTPESPHNVDIHSWDKKGTGHGTFRFRFQPNSVTLLILKRA